MLSVEIEEPKAAFEETEAASCGSKHLIQRQLGHLDTRSVSRNSVSPRHARRRCHGHGRRHAASRSTSHPSGCRALRTPALARARPQQQRNAVLEAIGWPCEGLWHEIEGVAAKGLSLKRSLLSRMASHHVAEVQPKAIFPR